MKTLCALALLALLPAALAAQTNVDRLVARLEAASAGTIDGWKYSTDFSRDPTGAGFDDSRWAPIATGQRLMIDSCWIRKEVTLPDRLVGMPTSGIVRFLVTVDDYGWLYVNGENR
ncbi:MAG TPA: hypothetical protein VMM80_10500, partial [Bacteroidota bacterium]|nr:hypothetical protein [Bacteroidota bacterium]